MNQPTIIQSVQQFISFLTSADVQLSNSAYGGIVGPHTLLIYDQPSVSYSELPFGKGSREELALSRIVLPQASEAAVWWADLWHGELIDFRIYHDPPFVALCISKLAVWSEMPDLYLKYPKRCFQPVDEQIFTKLAGPVAAQEMLLEQLIFGISVRAVIPQTSR